MNTNQNTYARYSIFALIVVVALVVGVSIFNSLHFRITGTTPSASRVSTISPFFKVNFNRELDSSAISVKVSPADSSSGTTVSGKTITISWNAPLQTSSTYTLSLVGLKDKSGHTLPNKTYTIRPKNISFKDLSKDEQQAILKSQAAKPRSVSVAYSGMAGLQKYGITNAQIADLEQALNQFMPKLNTASLDTSSIKPVPHDSTSTSTADSMNFNLKLNNKNYSARMDYFSLSVARVYLYDNGVQVFDSQNIDSQTPSTDY